MFDALLALLKTTYAKAGLSETALKAIATELAKTVTTDDAVKGAVDGVAGWVATMQAEADRRVEAAKKPADPKPADPKPADPLKPTEPPTGEVVPEWAKTLIAQNKQQADEIAAIKAGKTRETRKSQIQDALKDTTPKFRDFALKSFDAMQFKDDDAFEEYLAGVTTDAADFVQEAANDRLGGSHRPGVPTGVGKPVAPSKAEVDKILDKIM